MTTAPHAAASGPEYVIDCAPSDRYRFETAVAVRPSLGALRERGTRTLRSFPALLTDVFCYFYAPDPVLRDPPGRSADRLTYLILAFLRDTGEYQRIRRRTRLSQEAAIAATEHFGRKLLEYLEPEGRRRGQPRRAAADTPVEIERILFADRARVGDAASPTSPLLVIAKEIEGALDGSAILSDLSRSWGTDEGSLYTLPYEERAALARQVQQNQKLRRLAEIAGRYRDLAIKKQQRRVSDLPHEVFDVTQGDDFLRFLFQELVRLPDPALRYDFYVSLVERSVAQYDLEGEEPLGRGPLVVCVDTSGSMTGQPELLSKAFALGLLDIARLQQRNYAAILFSSAGSWRSIMFKGDRVTLGSPRGAPQEVSFPQGLIELGSTFIGGGTDYESPLREAIRIIREHADFTNGDIIFLTDDYCEVHDPFLEEYAAAKRAHGFSTSGILIGARAEDARTLRRFSDEVISAHELTADLAGRIFGRV